MIDPTPEQIEARNAALSAWQGSNELRQYSEFYTSFEDGYNAALVAAAGAAPLEPSAGKGIAYWAINANDPAVRADCAAARDLLAAARAEVDVLSAQGFPVGILLRLLAGVSPASAVPVDEARRAEVVPVGLDSGCASGTCPSWCSHLMWACPKCSSAGGWGAPRADLEFYAAALVCPESPIPGQVDEAKLAEVERAAAAKAWGEGEFAGTRNQRDFEQYRRGLGPKQRTKSELD